MNRFIAIVLALVLFPLVSNAQVPSPTFKQESKGYESFFPRNWNVIMADSADFNNDLREDYVFIFEGDKDYLNSLNFNTKLNAPPRVLLVIMGENMDTLAFGIKSDSVILRADGGEGDPLVQGTGIKTDGNILEINFAGGLSVQWTAQYRFAYSKTKEWTLATYKGTEYNTADEDAPIKTFEVDFNKKYMKQDKVKTPMPNLPKLYLDKFKPRTVTIAPGVVL
jgi:hypothetical protein